MRNRIPVVIAFTSNYIVPASVTVRSILSSSDMDECFLFICLLNEDLPMDQIRELQSLTGDRAEWRFLNLRGRLVDVYVDPKYTEAASYRLLLPEILLEWGKVIYIDCDILVRNDLARLYYETELGDSYVAGVFEATLPHQMDHMKQIGCLPGTYINSGFLIMNLELMRRDGISNKLLEALRTDYLEFPDQDALNIVCRGRIKGLSPIYNSIRTFFLPQYKADFLKFYSKEDWNSVQERGTIHYTGGKPWNILSVKFPEWWREFDELPEKIKKQMPVKKRLYLLYLVNNNKIGSFLIDGMRDLVRLIRYRV